MSLKYINGICSSHIKRSKVACYERPHPPDRVCDDIIVHRRLSEVSQTKINFNQKFYIHIRNLGVIKSLSRGGIPVLSTGAVPTQFTYSHTLTPSPFHRKAIHYSQAQSSVSTHQQTYHYPIDPRSLCTPQPICTLVKSRHRFRAFFPLDQLPVLSCHFGLHHLLRILF